MSIIIAGDIGGTKTTLGLFDFSEKDIHCIKQQTYSSHDFDQFNDILLNFFELIGISHIDILSLSIAGPVINQSCRTTNLPWNISATDLKKLFSIPHVHLINDIQATGYGLLGSSEKDLIQINSKAKFQAGNRAIISIGTGLGEACLYWDGKTHQPFGTEGGHSDFAPLIQTDLDLWQFFKKKFPHHISYERVISGPGIASLYDFLCERKGLGNSVPDKDKSAWISNQAMTNNNALCTETMELFIRFLANEAANLALKVFSIGGIYIAGGIAPKILPLLTQTNFMAHFIEKGRFKSTLQEMPVWVNKNENTPLHGAYWKALTFLP
jgi:glucokinase